MPQHYWNPLPPSNEYNTLLNLRDLVLAGSDLVIFNCLKVKSVFKIANVL